jgi:hypothetical protein
MRLMHVALIVLITAVVLTLVEIRVRSDMPWPEIWDEWRRFGYARSMACVAANAGLKLWAAFDPFCPQTIWRTGVHKLVPGSGALRANWRAVLAESERLSLAPIQNMHGGFQLTRGRWQAFVLKKHGQPFEPDALERMPRTCALLAGMQCEMAMLSNLGVGTRLKRHTGPFYGFLRYHLCLKGDGLAELSVGTEKYRWQPGEHVVFDETQPHSACNLGKVDRLVLFVDIVRPLGLGPIVRAGTRLTTGWHGW